MFELTGKYGKAKVYATTVDDACLSQIYNILNNPTIEGCKIAIMPDCNAGKIVCVGFTQEIRID